MHATTDVSPHLDRDAVHRRCLVAKTLKAGAEWETCSALLDALRSAVHESFGMTSVIEYADRFMGLSPRGTCERLRVARELEGLPRIGEALRSGELAWTVVREVSRVARAAHEDAWLEKVRGMSVHEVEELVARHEPGDAPDDPPSIRARRHRVVIELEADEYALYREAVGALTRDSGGPLREGQALALMARAVLGGPGDDGRSGYQVQLTVCEGCRMTSQDGRGREVVISDTASERALCDAQIVDRDGRASQDIPPATRRRVMRRDHGRCRAPGCRLGAWVDIHHIQLRSDGGDHDESNLLILCEAHHSALHEGRLFIEGQAPDVVFRHADGTPYGDPTLPSSSDAYADAFSALRHMGCPEAEARRALEAVRPHVGRGEPIEEIVRNCLIALRRGPADGTRRRTDPVD